MTSLQLYFILIGIGYLFPFSAMTMPIDYWRLLFPSENILFAITAVFLYTNIIILFMLVFKHNLSFNRIIYGFIGQFICLIIVPSSYFIISDSENINKIVILSVTAILAVSTAFLDSAVISLAGCFSPSCQSALQLGVGLSTLIGCLYRVGSKLAFSDTKEGLVVSSLVYFYTGAFTILLCIVAYMLLMRHPESIRRLKGVNGGANNDEDDDSEEALVTKPLLLATPDDALKDSSPEFSKFKAFKKSLFNGLCVLFVFLTTTVVWPGLITELKTFQLSEIITKDWYSLILLNVFAIMDVVGRFMVPFRFGVTKNSIWIPVLIRAVFIPIMIVAQKEIYFIHDAYSFVFVALLGWMNGWCGSQTILMMNECGDDPSEKRYIGTLASFYLNGGLVIGASVALVAFGGF